MLVEQLEYNLLFRWFVGLGCGCGRRRNGRLNSHLSAATPLATTAPSTATAPLARGF